MCWTAQFLFLYDGLWWKWQFTLKNVNKNDWNLIIGRVGIKMSWVEKNWRINNWGRGRRLFGTWEYKVRTMKNFSWFPHIFTWRTWSHLLLIPSYFYLKDMKPSGFYLMYIKSEPWTIISNLGYLLNIVYVYYAFLVWNNVESQGKISENAQGIQCEIVNVCTQKLPNKYVFFQMF